MAYEQDSGKSGQILEAAARLMREKSFKDLSMDELAAEAGVAKGTLYLYFRSKGDIYLSLLMEGVNTLHSMISQAVEDCIGSVRKKIETILDQSLKIIGDKPQSGTIPLLALPGVTPEEIEQDLKVQFFPKLEGIKNMLAGLFAEGMGTGEFRRLDPDRLAGVFLHLMEYCFVQTMLLADKPTEPATEIPFIKDLFFRGILA